MSGILPDRARELYGIPEGFQAVTALAIGHAGDGAAVADELRERDRRERTRRSQGEFVFQGNWGRAAEFE